MLREDINVPLARIGTMSGFRPRSLSDLGVYGTPFPPRSVGALTREDVHHVVDAFFQVAGPQAAAMATAELASLGVSVSTMRSELMPEVVERLARRLGTSAERARFLAYVARGSIPNAR